MILSDLFNDECRVKCSFGNNISPLEYYNDNYDSIIQYMKKKNIKINPFNMREAIYSNTIECSTHHPAIIKYFIDEHNLSFDEVCLWNILSNAKRSPTITLVNSYRHTHIQNGVLLNKTVLTEHNNTKDSDDSDTDDKVKPEVKPEVKLEVKLEVKPEVKLEVKPEVKLEVKPEVKLEVKTEVIPEVKTEVKPKKKLIKKTKVEPEIVQEVKPQEVKQIENIEYREEIVDGKKIRKKIIKKIVKKESIKSDSTKSNTDSLDKEEKKPVIKNLVESLIIPTNYDYRVQRKVKDFTKRLIKSNESESHIQLRKKVLVFLNNSTFIEDNKIKIKIFDLKKEDMIDFNNIDKLIYYLFE
jgi:hypothetical protein